MNINLCKYIYIYSPMSTVSQYSFFLQLSLFFLQERTKVYVQLYTECSIEMSVNMFNLKVQGPIPRASNSRSCPLDVSTMRA